MKRRTRKALISTLACGLLGISAIGVGNLKVAADSVAVKPTGTNTTTLTQAINDADLDSFKVYGASTRTKEPNGFRFLSVIDGSDLALIPNDAEFGLLIVPTAMLGEGELTVDTQNALIAPAKVNTTAAEIPDDGIGYYITLMGETLDVAFPEGLYNTVFTARAYAKYTYETNGEAVTDYAYSQSSLDRSIAYVASCELVNLETKGEADNVVKFFNSALNPLFFFFCRSVEFLCFGFAVLGCQLIKFLRIDSCKCGHLPELIEDNFIKDLFSDIMRRTMLTAFGLIITALEEVFLNRKALTSMKVKFLTAFTAEEVTCILVHLSLVVGAFATCKVLLHRVEQLSANDGFVCIAECQYLIGAILQTLFELVGFRIGLEVDRITAVNGIAENISDSGLRP